MSKITRTARSAADFVSGRIGARLLLILGCIVCLSVFAPYLKTVSITADGTTQTYITTRGSDPEELFTQVGLSLDSGDQYFEVVDDEDESQSEYLILRAFDIEIINAGVSGTYQATGGTVAEALAAAGVTLPDGDDEINCGLSDEVYAYMQIRIDRIDYVENTTDSVVAYQTLKHETSELTKGQTRVAQKGANGRKTVVTRDRYVNGVFSDTQTVKETVTAKPIDEIVDVGTAEPKKQTTATTTGGVLSSMPTQAANAAAGTFTDASGRTVSYSKVLTGCGTAYTEPKGSTTSTGREVEVGIVAVDPGVIPYNTRLYIVSADGRFTYGYALAADTGSALRNGDALVDLFYDTESQCRAFGRRDVIVYVLGEE